MVGAQPPVALPPRPLVASSVYLVRYTGSLLPPCLEAKQTRVAVLTGVLLTIRVCRTHVVCGQHALLSVLSLSHLTVHPKMCGYSDARPEWLALAPWYRPHSIDRDTHYDRVFRLLQGGYKGFTLPPLELL